MNTLILKIIFWIILLPGTAINTQAAVTDLLFNYGKTTDPGSYPSSWVQRLSPDSISDVYARHQEAYNFNAGDYVFFAIGLVNVDTPASVFIDKIELAGPSGAIAISNSGFENGTSDWQAWGSRDIEGTFSISPEAYEGSSAAMLTVSNSGRYAIHGQVPIAISQSGNYTLSVYTKVNEAEREIPPDGIFAMAVGNQWLYDSGIKREITKVDSSTFDKDTFEMTISANSMQIGKEFYEVWKGYLRFWGIHDVVFFKFGFGLVGGWFPASVGDQKVSMAWVVNYGSTVDLTVDILGMEQVTLGFDTLDAYRIHYDYVISGPGGATGITYDWWFVPYIGVVKELTGGGMQILTSFAVDGGNITETSDNDNDDLLDYKELITYNTDPHDSDSDDDGFTDGEEVNIHGTDPNDPDSHPARPIPCIPMLLLDD